MSTNIYRQFVGYRRSHQRATVQHPLWHKRREMALHRSIKIYHYNEPNPLQIYNHRKHQNTAYQPEVCHRLKKTQTQKRRWLGIEPLSNPCVQTTGKAKK